MGNDLGHFSESARFLNVSQTHAGRRSNFLGNLCSKSHHTCNIFANNHAYTNTDNVVESKSKLVWYNSALKQDNYELHGINNNFTNTNATSEIDLVEFNEMADTSLAIQKSILDSCIGNSVTLTQSTLANDVSDAITGTNKSNIINYSRDNIMYDNSILSRGTNKISSTEDILGNNQEKNNRKLLDSGLFLNNTFSQTQQHIQHTNMSKNTCGRI